MNIKTLLRVQFVIVSFLILGSCSVTDSVVASVVWVGCNRRGNDWEKSDLTDPSGANVAQLTQTVTDLNNLQFPAEIKPFFFLAGDLVPGMKTPEDLTNQLNAWATLYRSLKLSSNYNFVPLPGNHEMLTEYNGNEILLPGADAAWLSWLHANQFDTYAGNGPTTAAPNLDSLVDDQSKLSYSFDSGSVHYVVLNTDTLVSNTSQIGWIPLNWLKQDLASAQNNSAIRTILVFGHKPLLPAKPPVGQSNSGTDLTLDSSLVAPLAQLLDSTTKVKAYLCAHVHSWDAQQLPGTRGVWQIISGFGGSPLTFNGNPASGAYFGFTLLNIYQSGKVSFTEYRRPAPNPYTATPTVPAVAQPEQIVSY